MASPSSRLPRTASPARACTCSTSREAALSVGGALALVAIVARAARTGAQFIIATHSPILLACPGATIYELTTAGLAPGAYDDLDTVRLARGFLQAPDRYLRAALDELEAS
jgi:predicted ATPase